MSQSSNPNAKLFAILSYLGIFWIVGLVAAKDDPFVHFHVNQGLVLFLLNVALSIMTLIPIIGWIIALVGYIFSVVCFILGILHAARDEMAPLPLIGSIQDRKSVV